MKVFIGEIKKIIPQSYSLDYIVDRLYPPEKVGEKTNRMIHKFAKNIGFSHKPVVINLEKLPECELKKEEYHPVNWGVQMVDILTQKIGKENVGFLSVSYNISYHIDFLPNLASQIILKSGLEVDTLPEEVSYYGCASGIFSIKSAVEYCKKYNRAAVVFTFDQCSKIAKLTYNTKDPYFKKTIKSYLLFSDGAVGLLILPETLAKNYQGKLIEIKDIVIDYTPGDKIKSENGFFLLDNEVKDVIPPVVSQKVVKPVLEKNRLNISDISEWSIHQGGIPILERFKEKDILGLSEEQIKRSRDLFGVYGNMSSPSCLLVLESFFNEDEKKSSRKGVVAGFGAGYYMGSMLYQWV